MADEYRKILLQAPGLTTVQVDEDIAEAAAGLRARHNRRTPDAIQLASAFSAGASWFLTNDADLTKVPGVSVVVLKNLQ